MGDGGSKSTQTTTIPEELKPLYSNTAEGLTAFQDQNALTGFAAPHPQGVAGLSENQNLAAGMVGNMGAPAVTYQDLMNSPTVQAQNQAFEQFSKPVIQNEMTLSGLGRSKAGGDAIAMGQASQLYPVMSEELARRERGTEREYTAAMETGEMQRDVEQAGLDAEWNDFLRQQGLTEQAYFAPLGSFVPSTLGTQTTTSGGGMFK